MTGFIEESIMVAALEEDQVEVDRLIGEMLPGEQTELYRAVRMIALRLEEA